MASLPPRISTLAPSTLALLATLTLGCFKADDGAEEVGDETAGETSTGGDTGETSSEDSSSVTDEGPQPIPPSIDVFTVAGSESPAEITAAGAVAIVVEASDADGQIAKVELLRDGEVFASLSEPPYVGEFVIGGESFDGNYDFTARAVDDDDLEATAGPINLDVNVPNGGVVETWTWDGGQDDVVYRVWAGPEGGQVVAAGMTLVDNANVIRVDRVVGPAWTDTVGMLAAPASGIVGLPNGEFAATSWNNVESIYMKFGPGGALQTTDVANWPPANVAPENFEAPLDLAGDAEGNTYAVGIFATGLDYDAMMLRQHDSTGTVGWTVYGINPMTYPVPPYPVRLDVAGEVIAVGGQLRQADPVLSTPWFARFSTQGGLVSQVEPVDFEGIIWAIGIGDAGDLVIGGGRNGDNGTTAWAARYDAGDQQVWLAEPMHPGLGAVVAADIDPWGNSVLVAVVDCESGFLSTTSCDLVVRKHDPSGALIWEQVFDDDGFLGFALVPMSGDIHFDRFGYAYVAISHAGPNMNLDWWITKFNP